ncbi:hypothetical protein [Mycobacterium shimoidei]|uniref:hypothetical protein n=1 Tax=Mycobacterium shimoidei TaxID=29313 RepID=UPI001E2A54EA|nr:hypothetical protein [Mycobacterium shimoidei]
MSAATVVAALGLSACSGNSAAPRPTDPLAGNGESDSVASATASPLPPSPVTPTPAPAAPMPAPDALTEVLYRLADPSVPGTEKLNLVEGATPDNAATLDKFATALLDGGYAPMTFVARDIVRSDRNPADVVATVDVTTPSGDASGFSFPMEFKPYQGGWQLSQRTAQMLLAFGSSQTAPTPPPPSPSP